MKSIDVSFRQLELWRALAETGSVGGAARLLGVTQPTASAQLKDLTRAIGLPLYEVISKRVRLTAVGEELARTARRVFDEWESFEQLRDATRGLARGRLRIAAVSTAKYFIPRIVGRFCERYPGIDVSLEILNRDGVVARLRDNRDDIYVMSMPPDDMDLVAEEFMDNPLVLIAPRRRSNLGKSSLALADLKTERFVLREPGSGTRLALDRHFRHHRFKPQIRMELGSNEAVKEAVAGGLGLGVVSAHALKSGASRAGVAVLDVAGFPLSSRWHVVYPAKRILSPVAEAFKAELLAARGELIQPPGAGR